MGRTFGQEKAGQMIEGVLGKGRYVLKDDSNIVYVGSTGDVDTRSNQHMSDKYFTN